MYLRDSLRRSLSRDDSRGARDLLRSRPRSRLSGVTERERSLGMVDKTRKDEASRNEGAISGGGQLQRGGGSALRVYGGSVAMSCFGPVRSWSNRARCRLTVLFSSTTTCHARRLLGQAQLCLSLAACMEALFSSQPFALRPHSSTVRTAAVGQQFWRR